MHFDKKDAELFENEDDENELLPNDEFINKIEKDIKEINKKNTIDDVKKPKIDNTNNVEAEKTSKLKLNRNMSEDKDEKYNFNLDKNNYKEDDDDIVISEINEKDNKNLYNQDLIKDMKNDLLEERQFNTNIKDENVQLKDEIKEDKKVLIKELQVKSIQELKKIKDITEKQEEEDDKNPRFSLVYFIIEFFYTFVLSLNPAWCDEYENKNPIINNEPVQPNNENIEIKEESDEKNQEINNNLMNNLEKEMNENLIDNLNSDNNNENIQEKNIEINSIEEKRIIH